MKIIRTSLIITSILFSTMLLSEESSSHKKPIIISDINEVIIDKSLPLQLTAQLGNLVKIDKKDTNKQSAKIQGLIFQLLSLGMKKWYLTSHIAWMVERVEKSRRPIEGTIKIYQRLKEKGYPIVFATNKDHIEYDLMAQAMGEKITSLADKIFVSHSENSPEFIARLQAFADLPTTPASYKNLLEKALTIQPTKMILHAPGEKPGLRYYEYVINNLGKENDMVFIDDQIRNVDSFKTTQDSSSGTRIGIQFDNPQQLAQDFINLGFLSEQDDQDLLQKIRNPGMWGKIKLTARKLISPRKPATNAMENP